MRIFRRCVFSTVLLISLTATTFAAEPLHILLTNDDGYDSAGLEAVKQVLLADGYRVTVVAPLGQRSGSGMKITLGEFAVVEQAPAVWSVDASPADAISIALKTLLKTDPPDFVISGANFGQNLGSNAFLSGTVGAAMMAVLSGVPAIAISVGIDLEEHHAEPVRFPSTVAAFPHAASLTAKVLKQLLDGASGGILPPRTMLNINYPARAEDEVKGIRWTRQGWAGGFVITYPEGDSGLRKSSIEIDADGLGDEGADTAAFSAGYVTLSLLSPDWRAAAADADAVQTRLMLK